MSFCLALLLLLFSISHCLAFSLPVCFPFCWWRSKWFHLYHPVILPFSCLALGGNTQASACSLPVTVLWSCGHSAPNLFFSSPWLDLLTRIYTSPVLDLSSAHTSILVPMLPLLIGFWIVIFCGTLWYDLWSLLPGFLWLWLRYSDLSNLVFCIILIIGVQSECIFSKSK